MNEKKNLFAKINFNANDSHKKQKRKEKKSINSTCNNRGE